MKITKLIKTTFISLITIITFTQTTLAQKRAGTNQRWCHAKGSNLRVHRAVLERTSGEGAHRFGDRQETPRQARN